MLPEKSSYWFEFLEQGLLSKGVSSFFVVYSSQIKVALQEPDYKASRAYLKAHVPAEDYQRFLTSFRVRYHRLIHSYKTIQLPEYLVDDLEGIQNRLQLDTLSEVIDFLVNMDEADFKRYIEK